MRPEVIAGKQEKKFNRSFSISDCCLTRLGTNIFKESQVLAFFENICSEASDLAFFENICSEASLNIQRHRVREKSPGLPHKRTSYADKKG